MKFKFLGNAGGTFLGSKGTKILCDPWIVDGVFEGSWYHYPPLKKNIRHSKRDNICKSRSPTILMMKFPFPKDIPLIILDEGPNFLKNLMKMGYDNFVEIRDNQTKNSKNLI